MNEPSLNPVMDSQQPVLPPPNGCAPVLIVTYSRHDHLRRTVEALRRNHLAEHTDLYIASDHPRSDVDRSAIEQVRAYLDTVDGFRSVTVFRRTQNLGAARNQDRAFADIYEYHDRLIFLEDDVVTGRGFLKYMNDALAVYEPCPDVLAVCGYLWPLELSDQSRPLLLHAFCAWGFGVWRNKMPKATHTAEIHREFLSDRFLLKLMNRSSPHLLPLVRRCAREEIVAGDVEWHLYLLKCQKFAVFPPASLVRNIGLDGSGEHCGCDATLSDQTYFDGLIENVLVSPRQESREASRALYRYFGGRRTQIRNWILYQLSRWLPARLYQKIYSAARYLRDRRQRHLMRLSRHI